MPNIVEFTVHSRTGALLELFSDIERFTDENGIEKLTVLELQVVNE